MRHLTSSGPGSRSPSQATWGVGQAQPPVGLVLNPRLSHLRRPPVVRAPNLDGATMMPSLTEREVPWGTQELYSGRGRSPRRPGAEMWHNRCRSSMTFIGPGEETCHSTRCARDMMGGYNLAVPRIRCTSFF